MSERLRRSGYAGCRGEASKLLLNSAPHTAYGALRGVAQRCNVAGCERCGEPASPGGDRSSVVPAPGPRRIGGDRLDHLAGSAIALAIACSRIIVGSPFDQLWRGFGSGGSAPAKEEHPGLLPTARLRRGSPGPGLDRRRRPRPLQQAADCLSSTQPGQVPSAAVRERRSGRGRPWAVGRCVWRQGSSDRAARETTEEVNPLGHQGQPTASSTSSATSVGETVVSIIVSAVARRSGSTVWR